MTFRDRIDAGRRLAAALHHHPLPAGEVVVLGVPRGGVPVAAEVARALGSPLDIIVVRKLGVPGQPELGMGAVGEDGVRVLNPDILRLAGVTTSELAHVEARERAEVADRATRLRAGLPRLDLTGRVALIIDDGVATGGTVRAAVEVARAHGAASVVLALPVVAAQTLQELRRLADDVVALEAPIDLRAVGCWYEDFRPTEDAEVQRCLSAGRGDPGRPG